MVETFYTKKSIDCFVPRNDECLSHIKRGSQAPIFKTFDFRLTQYYASGFRLLTMFYATFDWLFSRQRLPACGRIVWGFTQIRFYNPGN